MKKSFLSLLLMVPVIAGAAITPNTNLDVDADECFLIRDAEDLYGFASKVNSDPTVCGKLTNNIIVNANLLGANKLPTECDEQNGCEGYKFDQNKYSYNPWTPFANFQGTFDGNGFYISGLFVVSDNQDEGLFVSSVGGQNAKTATIKNLGIVDSYLKGQNVGGLVGTVTGSLNIENSYCTSALFGVTAGGGLIGFIGKNNSAGTTADVSISNSYFAGLVKGNAIGGFVGKIQDNAKLSITNSYSVGEMASYSGSVVPASIIGTAQNNETETSIENVYSFGGFVGEGSSIDVVLGSFYLGNENFTSDSCEKSCSFKNSDIAAVTAALQGYNANGVDGSVWQDGVDHPVLKVAAVSGGVEIQTTDEGKKVFVIDGNSDANLFVNGEEKVDSVALLRTFTPNAYSTIILPFSGTIKNADVYTFDGVEKIENVWRATLRTVSGNVIKANTPYIIKPADDTLKFDNTNPITIVSNTDTVYVTEKGNWRFTGMYRFKKWVESELTNPSHIYGYAGSGATQKEFSAGQFVRGVAGVHISPTRAFLEYVPPVLSRRGMYRIAAPVDLPETIDVVIDDGEKSMTIGKLNTVTGEIKSDRWFDMKGRKLNAKPMVKGIYQNNGRQVIVK